MDPVTHTMLGAGIIASAIGAFTLCALVIKYGFFPPTEEPPAAAIRRMFITRFGHVLAAVCFVIAGVSGVVALAAAPGLAPATASATDSAPPPLDLTLLEQRLNTLEASMIQWHLAASAARQPGSAMADAAAGSTSSPATPPARATKLGVTTSVTERGDATATVPVTDPAAVASSVGVTPREAGPASPAVAGDGSASASQRADGIAPSARAPGSPKKSTASTRSGRPPGSAAPKSEPAPRLPAGASVTPGTSRSPAATAGAVPRTSSPAAGDTGARPLPADPSAGTGGADQPPPGATRVPASRAEVLRRNPSALTSPTEVGQTP